MTWLKTHYEVYAVGSKDSYEAWRKEGLILNKKKFCDGLMLTKNRHGNFTRKTDDVDCKKCQKKIDRWLSHGFNLPH